MDEQGEDRRFGSSLPSLGYAALIYLAVFFAVYLDERVFGTMWLSSNVPLGETGRRILRAAYWPLLKLFGLD